MEYTKKQIAALKDYLIQKISYNEGEIRFLLRELNLATDNYGAVQSYLKENKTYFALIEVLNNTATID